MHARDVAIVPILASSAGTGDVGAFHDELKRRLLDQSRLAAARLASARLQAVAFRHRAASAGAGDVRDVRLGRRSAWRLSGFRTAGRWRVTHERSATRAPRSPETKEWTRLARCPRLMTKRRTTRRSDRQGRRVRPTRTRGSPGDRPPRASARRRRTLSARIVRPAGVRPRRSGAGAGGGRDGADASAGSRSSRATRRVPREATGARCVFRAGAAAARAAVAAARPPRNARLRARITTDAETPPRSLSSRRGEPCPTSGRQQRRRRRSGRRRRLAKRGMRTNHDDAETSPRSLSSLRGGRVPHERRRQQEVRLDRV